MNQPDGVIVDEALEMEVEYNLQQIPNYAEENRPKRRFFKGLRASSINTRNVGRSKYEPHQGKKEMGRRRNVNSH